MTMISNLRTEDLEEMKPYANVAFSDLLHLSKETVANLWVEEVQETLTNAQAKGFAFRAEGKVLGMAVLAPLPWESGLLNESMFAIKHLVVDPRHTEMQRVLEALIQECIKWSEENLVDFLMCKLREVEETIDGAFVNQGFKMVDVLLDFTFHYDGGNSEALLSSFKKPADFELRLATLEDTDELVQTARACFSGHFGRFHSDPFIGPEKATFLYEEWIRSCLKGWADFVVLATQGGRIAAYSAWKYPAKANLEKGIKLGHYSIAATHPDFAGKGLFTFLTLEGMRRLQGVADYIEGPTHVDNFPVQRGYQKLGWKAGGKQWTYHKWLRRES